MDQGGSRRREGRRHRLGLGDEPELKLGSEELVKPLLESASWTATNNTNSSPPGSIPLIDSPCVPHEEVWFPSCPGLLKSGEMRWFILLSLCLCCWKLRIKFCAQLRRLPLAKFFCLVDQYHHLSLCLKPEIPDNILEFSVFWWQLPILELYPLKSLSLICPSLISWLDCSNRLPGLCESHLTLLLHSANQNKKKSIFCTNRASGLCKMPV